MSEVEIQTGKCTIKQSIEFVYLFRLFGFVLVVLIILQGVVIKYIPNIEKKKKKQQKKYRRDKVEKYGVFVCHLSMIQLRAHVHSRSNQQTIIITRLRSATGALLLRIYSTLRYSYQHYYRCNNSRKGLIQYR